MSDEQRELIADLRQSALHANLELENSDPVEVIDWLATVIIKASTLQATLMTSVKNI